MNVKGSVRRRDLLGLTLMGTAAATTAACNTSDSAAPATSATASSGPSPTGTGGSASSSGSATSPAAGPDVKHGPRDSRQVALTFHGAGDPQMVRRMIAALEPSGSKITVLAIGSWLAQNPRVAKELRDAGHELGNHTWSHQDMLGLSKAQVTTEVDRAAAELDRLTGSIGRWFRPSGTPRSDADIRTAAVKAGYGACLLYDVDPLDYKDPGPAAVERRFAAQVRPGSIVSLHLGHEGTLAAMPTLLTTLKKKGLRAVTATELMS